MPDSILDTRPGIDAGSECSVNAIGRERGWCSSGGWPRPKLAAVGFGRDRLRLEAARTCAAENTFGSLNPA
jgi:hypothetical protein